MLLADIVAAYVVPHTPSFVAEVKANGERSETARFFGEIGRHLMAARPDVIVSISNDHFNTFFLDNWPTFAIGLADRTAGPSDQTPEMPWYEVEVASDLARHLFGHLVADAFDVARSLEFQLDHAHLVPLHFLTPEMSVPIVPVFINCIVPPLPSSRRCHRLGRSLAEAIASWSNEQRVAILASGSLSLEIGGPRAFENKTFGVPDPDWASWVLEQIRTGRIETLIEAASQERMLEAGNVAGELLTWIAALGAVGPATPDILVNQPELGNAFAAWTPKGVGR
ncbi:protocatechuate 4,5-dioxygenase beta chain [Methylobacterium brachythecii]|uniref:Extradiol dioxygenase n=1 Tax=Methylobacterium brachythecii TaxID=1176177 RepID=A0A7W6F841_9HYPH|nr:protocatechuate 4,5-dioxygenase beta chain [Methylobacterium brachythecii]GLS42809.1 extradiol dioxygenase [Methylobacterium brachythecii]